MTDGAYGLGPDRAVGGLVRVVDVEHLGGRSLRVEFSDGLVRELDLTGQLSGVLALIDDDAAFGRVSVDPVAGTCRGRRASTSIPTFSTATRAQQVPFAHDFFGSTGRRNASESATDGRQSPTW